MIIIDSVPALGNLKKKPPKTNKKKLNKKKLLSFNNICLPIARSRRVCGDRRWERCSFWNKPANSKKLSNAKHKTFLQKKTSFKQKPVHIAAALRTNKLFIYFLYKKNVNNNRNNPKNNIYFNKSILQTIAWTKKKTSFFHEEIMTVIF